MTDATGALLFSSIILYLLSGALGFFREKTYSYLSAVTSLIASIAIITIAINTLVSGEGEIYATILPGKGVFSDIVMGVDPLSAAFLLIIGIVSLAVSLYVMSSSEKHPRVHGIGSLLLVSIIFVLILQNLFWFLFAWEVMTLLSYVLIVQNYENPEVKRAGLLYFVLMHIGAACLIMATILLYIYGNPVSLSFSALKTSIQNVPPAITSLVFILFLIAFGMKAGLVPMHVWLPRAYGVAAPLACALLSSTVEKMGAYGAIRAVVGILVVSSASLWWGMLLLVISFITVFVGSSLSVMQDDLRRLLAYSTIENMGIIFTAIACVLLSYSMSAPQIASIGIIVALLHSLNHAVFKTLLFINTDMVARVGEPNISKLGGLSRYMPWTSYSSAIGSIAAAGLPPLNGFASKYLAYQLLLLLAFSSTIPLAKLLLVIAALSLVLGGAFVAISFSNMYSSSFLGLPYSGLRVDKKIEAIGLKASVLVLIVVIVFLGVYANSGVSLLKPAAVTLSGIEPSLRISGLFISITDTGYMAKYSYPLLGVLLLLGYIASLIIDRSGQRKFVKAPPFVSGVDYDPSMKPSYTALVQPVRELIGRIYGIRVVKLREWAVKYWVTARLVYMIESAYKLPKISIRISDISIRYEKIVYEPFVKLFTWLGSRTKKLQSGSLIMYVLYIFATALILLLLSAVG